MSNHHNAVKALRDASALIKTYDTKECTLNNFEELTEAVDNILLEIQEKALKGLGEQAELLRLKAIEMDYPICLYPKETLTGYFGKWAEHNEWSIDQYGDTWTSSSAWKGC